jgi:hypothetical protein
MEAAARSGNPTRDSGALRHVPLIWKQLDYPDAPELLRLLMLGGVDRDLEKVAALAAAPLIGQKAPSQNPAWLLIKPPTCLYIAVDPEGQYFARLMSRRRGPRS